MIFNEDCLLGLKKIADASVDMICADPPYGTTNCSFDKRVPFEPMWKEFARITKPNAAIVLFSQMPFGAELMMSSPIKFRYEWIWEKSLAVGFLNAKRMPLRAHENILVFYRKLPTYNPQFSKGKPYKKHYQLSNNYGKQSRGVEKCMDGKRFPRDVIRFQSLMGTGMIHPQQKPLGLVEYLIKTYTNEGELVVDPFMGSGTTAIACKNFGRRFIGFEIDEDIFRVAQNRLIGK